MIFIYIFATFSLSFFLKELDGPFDFMSKLRGSLLRNKYVGVLFYKIFNCFYCLNFYSSFIIYFLMFGFQIKLMICHALACAILGLFLSKFL